ncbi:MAG: ubiquitin-like small modifier protein 1 [Haloarculaceae archaeon]|jgi:molybdopterin synthase sulfur carrier subunit
MSVECVLFGPLREAVGEKRVRVENGPGTVGELLDHLEREYPALEGRLLDDGGAGLVDGLAVTLDKKHVQHLDGLDTDLSDGDVVRMTPAVYGG